MFPMKQGHNVLILTPPKSYQAQPHLKELGTEHVLKGPALVLGPPLGPNVAESTLVRSPAAHDPRFLAQPASHRYPKPLPPTAPLALAALQDLMLPVEATVSWSLSSYSQTVKLAEAGEQGAQTSEDFGPESARKLGFGSRCPHPKLQPVEGPVDESKAHTSPPVP